MRTLVGLAGLCLALAGCADRNAARSQADAHAARVRAADEAVSESPQAQAQTASAPASSDSGGAVHDAGGELALDGLDPALAAQIRAVIDAMDRTGRPPDGVAQGGRRGGARGLFENAEGRLPRRARGYYTESDVWPRTSGDRGAQRLVFGRGREVYYTADHYRSFVQVRR